MLFMVIVTVMLSTVVFGDAQCDCSCKVECKNVYKNPTGGDFNLVDITRKIHLWPNVDVAAGGDTEYPDDRTCTQQISDEEVKDNGFLDPSEQCPDPLNVHHNKVARYYSDFDGNPLPDGGYFHPFPSDYSIWKFNDKTGIDMKLFIHNNNQGEIAVKLTLDTAAQRCEEDTIQYYADTNGEGGFSENWCYCGCQTTTKEGVIGTGYEGQAYPSMNYDYDGT